MEKRKKKLFFRGTANLDSSWEVLNLILACLLTICFKQNRQIDCHESLTYCHELKTLVNNFWNRTSYLPHPVCIHEMPPL